MIKQLLILAMAAAFGVAHAADVKPTAADAKAVTAPVAVSAKATEAKPAVAPEVKKEAAKTTSPTVKKAKKHAKKPAGMATPAVKPVSK